MARDALSVVVPFRRNLAQLEECLAALARRKPGDELIVVGDEPQDDPVGIASKYGARIFTIRGPVGPAAARNLGAAHARNPVLVFVDSDVVVAPDALARIRTCLDRRPELGAVFGSYDESPRHPSLISQYRNLSHAYFHQQKRGPATTFWAGLGAVRTRDFRRVGGFDPGFPRPSVEDIDLGYRLTDAGVAIALDASIRGCHLKRWTLRSGAVTDVRDRGIPWMRLMLRRGRVDNDLNVSLGQRVSLVLAYLTAAGAAAAVVSPAALALAAVCLAGFLLVNWPYYRFFAARRGWWFTARIVPAHLLHHLGNGVAAVSALAAHHAARFRRHALTGGVVPAEGAEVLALSRPRR